MSPCTVGMRGLKRKPAGSLGERVGTPGGGVFRQPDWATLEAPPQGDGPLFCACPGEHTHTYTRVYTEAESRHSHEGVRDGEAGEGAPGEVDFPGPEPPNELGTH